MSGNFETRGIGKKTFLYQLFYSWHKTLEDFEDKMYKRGELGYDYKERSNIGLVAAAAAKKGCLVLEEFTCDKRHGRKTRLGRGDLWIKPPEGKEYQFEAKRVGPNVRSIQKEVQKAVQDVECDLKEVYVSDIPRRERPKLTGIVFVVPYVPKRQWHRYNIKSLKNTLLDLKSLGVDFSAIHFCKQEIRTPTYGLPCVAIVGKYYKDE
jgi:hypothetical protein